MVEHKIINDHIQQTTLVIISQLKSIQRRIRIELCENISFGFTIINMLYKGTTRT